MLRIGLTGSMATGKSTVLESFARLGVPVYSADTAVHEIYAGEAVPLVETLFPGVVSGGSVDRKRLGAALAREPERLGELESVVHPLVRQKAMAFFDAAAADGADVAVVEVPLLFETGSKYPVDEVVVTICDPQIQRARILARPGMTEQKMKFVLARQMSQQEKAALADHVIDTSSGGIEQTRAEAEALLARWRGKS